MALESDLVTADMVEVTEFPQLGVKYGVYGVPKTVVNDQPGIEGMLPEEAFVNAVLGMVKKQRT